MTTIYIRLIDEGTDAFRPAEAELLESGFYRLQPTPNYDPEDEHWEFTPGTIVRGEQRKMEGEEVLVAVAAYLD